MQSDYQMRNQYTGAIPLIDRFWGKVDIGSFDECWNWIAGLNSGGYGQITTGLRKLNTLKPELAHRIAYQLSTGRPIEPNTMIIHSCDNPPCCNPAHLSPGTHQENQRQKAERGRSSKLGSPKLNRAQVIEIKALLAAGEHTQLAIARKYGVTDGCIYSIKVRQIVLT